MRVPENQKNKYATRHKYPSRQDVKNTAAKIGMVIAIAILAFTGITAIKTFNQNQTQHRAK